MGGTMTNIQDLPARYRAKGHHVETAFIELCIEVLPAGTTLEQYEAMRLMFFSGNLNMYDAIVTMGEDLEFMDQIRKELGEFAQTAVLENETEGHA